MVHLLRCAFKCLFCKYELIFRISKDKVESALRTNWKLSSLVEFVPDSIVLSNPISLPGSCPVALANSSIVAIYTPGCRGIVREKCHVLTTKTVISVSTLGSNNLTIKPPCSPPPQPLSVQLGYCSFVAPPVIKHFFYFCLEASQRPPLLCAWPVSLLDWSSYSGIRGFINEHRAGFTRRGAKLVGKLLRGQWPKSTDKCFASSGEWKTDFYFILCY